MRFRKLSSSIVAGAAGFLGGILYCKYPLQRPFLVSSAKPVDLDIGEIISDNIERHAIEFVPIMKHGFPSYDTLRVNRDFVFSYDSAEYHSDAEAYCVEVKITQNFPKSNFPKKIEWYKDMEDIKSKHYRMPLTPPRFARPVAHRRNRIPYWVMEHLTPNMIVEDKTNKVSRKKAKFFEDKSIHEFFRASLKDYIHSGYDRGHLAAAANYKYNQESLNDTFMLSSITPQDSHFNNVTWYALENHVRKLLKRYRSIYVCSGPLYLPRVFNAHEEEIIQLLQGDRYIEKGREKYKCSHEKKFVIYEVIGEHNVAVPSHFFKIILCEDVEGNYDMEAYIIPNQHLDTEIPLENYMVPRDAIERAAGFLLFHHVPLSAFRRINTEIQESNKEEYMDES